MKCFNPVSLPNPAAVGIEDRNITVSCGKCYACLANRRRSWLFRLQCECSVSFPFFVTLTYENEDVQYSGFLNKYHIDQFVDSLRKVQKFKYYLIGEYGTHTLRPHYHAILFFRNKLDINKLESLLKQIWYHGFISVSPVTYRRLNYVLHYHTRPKEPVKGLKTFQRFSNGLGRSYLYDTNGEFRSDIVNYLKNAALPVVQDFEGNSYVIPRYYRKKMQEAGLIPVNERVVDIDTRYTLYWRNLGKKPYQLTDLFKCNILSDLNGYSKKMIEKFNNQDKFM